MDIHVSTKTTVSRLAHNVIGDMNPGSPDEWQQLSIHLAGQLGATNKEMQATLHKDSQELPDSVIDHFRYNLPMGISVGPEWLDAALDEARGRTMASDGVFTIKWGLMLHMDEGHSMAPFFPTDWSQEISTRLRRQSEHFGIVGGRNISRAPEMPDDPSMPIQNGRTSVFNSMRVS